MSQLNLTNYDNAMSALAAVIRSQTQDQEFDSFDDPTIERTAEIENALQNVRQAVASFVWDFEGYSDEKARRENAMECVANDLTSVERLAEISRCRLVFVANVKSNDKCRASLASIGLRAAGNAEALYHVELIDGGLPRDKSGYTGEFIEMTRNAAEALNA
jgi:hypothetical protein